MKSRSGRFSWGEGNLIKVSPKSVPKDEDKKVSSTTPLPEKMDTQEDYKKLNPKSPDSNI